MTTAFPEPYGLALRGNGVDNSFRPLYDPLPKGVNHITLSTQHTGQVILRVFPQSEWGEGGTILGVIPAGTGYRSITVTHSVGAGENQYISATGGTTLPANARCSMTVVTIPLKGAGGG